MPWIKKTAQEIKKQNKKSSLISLCLVFIGSFLFFMLGQKLGLSKTGQNYPMTWEEIRTDIPEYLVFSTVITIFASYILFFDKKKDDFLICIDCWKARNYQEIKICECGGELQPISQYTWISETDQNEVNKSS